MSFAILGACCPWLGCWCCCDCQDSQWLVEVRVTGLLFCCYFLVAVKKGLWRMCTELYATCMWDHDCWKEKTNWHCSRQKWQWL